MTPSLNLLGFASGIAANNPDCALGPWYLYYHPELFTTKEMLVHWQTMIQTTSSKRGADVLTLVEDNVKQLGLAVLSLAREEKAFCVIGGDHSCAIGTWSAVAHANRLRGDIGLIWIDAHMDSHTPTTSTTQNIHGMPVAHLLGEGTERLTQLFDSAPKIKPNNLIIIGIRSYEPSEAALLKRLGVTVIFMEEVRQRGIHAVLTEASHRLTQTTCGFGISIDMDAIDPHDAPGVGCPEAHGLEGAALVSALQSMPYQSPFLGLELTEFNPIVDQDGKTAKLLVNLMHAVFSGTTP